MCSNRKENLIRLKGKFLSCYPVKSINWQDLRNLSWDDQIELLHNTVLHPLNKSQPIKSSYQLSFLKCLIKTLEEANCEIHDHVYECFCYLQSSIDDPDSLSYKHYCIPSRDIVVTLKESKTFISNGTTGLCSWQASLALSEWLLKNVALVANKIVLELGAGTGLSGIVAARCCRASQVTLSDGSPVVVNLLQENVQLNCTESNLNIETLLLRWEEVESSDLNKGPMPEILIGADLIYDNAVFPALTKVLDSIFSMKGNSCIFYLAATVRNEDTLQEFISLLERKSFQITEEKYESPLNDFFWDESTPIKIFSIIRK